MRAVSYEEQLADIQNMTLMDDVFMRIFFKDNIPCTELVLRIIMDKPDLIVKTVKVQYVLKSADGARCVRLDVYAVDADGRHYNIEIQNASSGASVYRARLNSAMLDANILKSKEDYTNLKERESVVIFITDKDVLGDSEPIYIIDRVILKSGKPFGDGSHIVYVNSSHQDLSTALGRLMHDFKCKRPKDMNYPLLANTAEKVKEGSKEGENMNVWVEMEREAFAEGKAEGKAEGLAEGEAKGKAEGKAEGLAEAGENIAINLIRDGLVALEIIAKSCGLTLQRVQELAALNRT